MSFSFSCLEKKRAKSSLFGLRQSGRSKWQRRDFIVKATFAHLLAIRYNLNYKVVEFLLDIVKLESSIYSSHVNTGINPFTSL